jgi:hypothetical protein
MYLSIDKAESNQVHQLYAMPEAFAAARKDQPMPSGTVFTVVLYAAQLDGQGNPIKGADGQFVKGEVKAANATWIDFFNKDDFAGVASLYTEDASAFPPGSGIVKGRAATIEALWKSMAEHWRVVTQNECLARPTPGRRPTSRPSTR